MSLARGRLNWGWQLDRHDKERFIEVRKGRPTNTEACSMCGDLCAIKLIQEMLGRDEGKGYIESFKGPHGRSHDPEGR